MSKQSYLEKLLDGEEVEWKKLWEVSTWDKKFKAVDRHKQPNVIKYHYFLSKEIKPLVVEGGNVKLLTTNISDLYTTEELAGDKLAEGEVVGIPGGGNPVVHYYKGKFLTSDNRLATSNEVSYLNNQYLYYFMLSELELIKSFYRGSGIKHPSMSSVLELQIPIPPLKVQKEIVRILDAFTKLTTELTTELNMRKKQYNYYRDRLFDFDDGDYVKWKPLGEVFDIFAGSDKPKDSFSDVETNEFNVPILSNGIGEKSLYGWTEKAKVIEPSLTVSARGTIGWTSYRDQPFFPIIRLLVLTPKVRVNLKYAYYYMKTIEKKYNVVESGIPQLTKPMITGTPFPIPYPDDPKKSLAEQSRIVSILDKFDALTNSISEGLPREINLRQKQYEYYRDLLLSFPKSAEVDS